MILLAYDGSDHGRRAIETAGSVLGGRAVVVHVAEHEAAALAPGLGLGVPVSIASFPDVHEQEARRARATLEEGCRLAAEAGFAAVDHQLLHGAGTHGVREALLSAAEEWDVELVVLGRRGLGPLKAAVLGSVSGSVIHHAARPVLVVPPPAEP